MNEEDIAEMEAEREVDEAEGDPMPEADDFDGEREEEYPFFDDEEPDIDEAQEWADIPYGPDEDHHHIDEQDFE